MQIFEDWSPRWTAWEKDNPGLQVGDRRREVTNVLIALDVTREIVDEAVAQKSQLIVSHHPLLFRPLRSVTADDDAGNLVLLLAKHNIALYSAHTNLDAAPGGVSFTLAETLGLRNVRFLAPLEQRLAKVVTFVPESAVDAVRSAMAHAGAGTIGEYSACAFEMKGEGRFRASENSHPVAGKRGEESRVPEVRLEMLVPRARISAVAAAMKSAHPYEEAAYDVYETGNPDPNHGMGAIGELPSAVSLGVFLKRVKRELGCGALRYTGGLKRQVRTVAVCGGAGSDLLPDALRERADVFITADVRYHAFHTAGSAIALVDAGHWETEQVVLKQIAGRIRAEAGKTREALTVRVTKHCTNPIQTM